MTVLALDTSGGIAVSVLVPGRAAHTVRVAQDRQHAELLAPLIAEALSAQEAVADDVSTVVVGTGPAPFTGLRAGIVAARTFAFARRIPIWGVPSLDALAQQAVLRGFASDHRTLVVLTDARRREVYWARYDAMAPGESDQVSGAGTLPGRSAPSGVARLLSGPEVARPQSLIETGVLSDAVVVAAGRIAAVEVAGISLASEDLWVDPAVLAEIAQERHTKEVPLPTEPLYLRRPDAQVPSPARRAL